MTTDRINDEAQKEADRLIYLHVNGGGGNPDLHLRLAALLRMERAAPHLPRFEVDNSHRGDGAEAATP